MVQFPNGPEAVYTVIGGGDIYSHTNEVEDKEVVQDMKKMKMKRRMSTGQEEDVA